MSPAAAFLDATRLVALLDRDEPEHANTENMLHIELNAEVALVTSNYDVVKASLELQRRHGDRGAARAPAPARAVPARRMVYASRPRRGGRSPSRRERRHGGAKDLVDCVAAEIARRVGITPMF